MAGRVRTYTYKEIADIFKVRIEAVRRWKSNGEFRILGYVKKSKWKKVALVGEDEVKRLLFRKLIKPLR